ncbi:hypothetical protein ACFE33_02165 [Falsihalocynthiibacter sp. SS001]|uniref:hypothetical protein n=1 Tax=Falsihalocynthiibacter sp. SS001 TaxID=3349698 RepID=UPI0036D20F8D
MTNASLLEKARANRTAALESLKGERARQKSRAMFHTIRTAKPTEDLLGAFGKPAHVEDVRLAA